MAEIVTVWVVQKYIEDGTEKCRPVSCEAKKTKKQYILQGVSRQSADAWGYGVRFDLCQLDESPIAAINRFINNVIYKKEAAIREVERWSCLIEAAHDLMDALEK
jgi:hypothetical protein